MKRPYKKLKKGHRLKDYSYFPTFAITSIFFYLNLDFFCITGTVAK